MFTSRNRVVRDGYLVAFEGEVMSDEEALRRGLLDPEPEERPKAKGARRRARASEAVGRGHGGDGEDRCS